MFDLHCHILPGVDDGASTVAEARDMLRAAKAHGVNIIMCTPHVRWESYNQFIVNEAYSVMKSYAIDLGIDFYLGYEVNWKKLVDIGMEHAPEFTLGDTNLFLLELNDEAMPTNWQRFIYTLQGMDLQVVIAHPERYRDIQKNIQIAYQLKEMGCYLQLSANFIEGGKFDPRYRTAHTLLKDDLVDYVASDAHCVADYTIFAKALHFCQK